MPHNLAVLMQQHLSPEKVTLLREIGEVAFAMDMTAYAVGGFVRDLLLGTPTLDVDIVVEGNGSTLARALAKRWNAKLTGHERFMTATLQLRQKEKSEKQDSLSAPLPSLPFALCPFVRVDIATARRERYPKPAVLPEVEPATITDDLWRRDFTINAMAICLAPDRFGELVDPTGGYDDLQRGIIRVLHDKSFVDDPTRIFRAVRYEQRFGFFIDRKTLRLLKEARDASLLTKLTCDRIKHELWRILQEREPDKPLWRLKRLGIFPIVAPELRATPKRLVWLRRLGEWLDWHKAHFPDELLGREGALLLPLLPNESAVHSFCRRYQLGERERKMGIGLLQAMGNREPKRRSGWVRWLNPLPTEAALALAAKRADVADRQWKRYFLEWRKARPDISGEDLKAHGITGRAIAIGLQAALVAKLDRNSDAAEQLRVALKAARCEGRR